MEKFIFLVVAILTLLLSSVSAEVCGDSICDGNETKATCSADCDMFRLGIFEPIALNNVSSTYNWSIHYLLKN